ncbi:hypothetical protein [Microbispora sp. NPDC049125]|uniref:hypothetical protein n=1 Tax=Microbispora sp. NPDC049125 TaxID=3154929 RepID=UPI0034672854
MRVVYRIAIIAAVMGVVGGGAAVLLAGRGGDSTPGAAGVVSSQAPTDVATGAPAGAASALSTAEPSTPPSPGVSAASSGATPAATASPSPSPGTTAMDAALSDPRVPPLPASDKKLRTLPGHVARTRGLVKDRRSGVAFTRFAKEWKLTKASPFASRQVLPKVKGSAYRGILVSCPVPIPVQETLRDTAFLAARWTLNHHPSGATLTWTASQSLKVGKRDAWLLGYDVHYTLKGKDRTSSAAIALVDVRGKKPALVFVSIPDSQKKRWHDINKVMSSIKTL